MAVAENQPNKYRMSDLLKFDGFAARLSGMIRTDGVADEDFGPLARELHHLQCDTIVPLGSLSAVREIAPEFAGDWRCLPAMPAAMFKEWELTSLPPGQRPHHFLSSGTTEQARSRHFHSDESLRLYELSLLEWFARNVADSERTRFLSLTPAPDAAPNSSLVHMFGCVGRNQGGSVYCGFVDKTGAWEVDCERLVELLTGPNASLPVRLMGTAFSFVHLLDWMESQRIDLQLAAGSKVIETGGYKGRSRVVPRSELYQKMRIRFGVWDDDIVCEYGMSELSSQAYDTGRSPGSDDRFFRFPSWARALVISPETGGEVSDGETGLLRIFDLANVYSVMAIQTEDLAVRNGNEFSLIGRMPRSEPRGCSLMTATDQ
jgi:hypothetical protein